MAKGSTTIESRAASAGAFVATPAGRFALRNHHAPPAITMSRPTSAAASGASPKRLFCRVAAAGVTGSAGFRLRGDADLKRIDVDRLSDVLELGRAEIRHRQVEAPFHLPIGLLGETDRAGLSDAFQPRSDVDPVAHQIAVALLDHIAHMDADAELDAPVLRHAGIAFDHRVLQFDGAAHRIDDTAKFDDAAVAGALDDAAMMDGDRRVEQVAAQRSEPSEDAIFVRPGEPAITNDVRTRIAASFRVSLIAPLLESRP